MFLKTFNFNAVSDLLSNRWKNHLNTLKREVKYFAKEWPYTDFEIEELLSLDRRAIRQIISLWWRDEGANESSYLMKQLALHGTEILRGDHTYKITKSLGGTSGDGVWVSAYAKNEYPDSCSCLFISHIK